jgi:hypothetical protein
MNGDRALFGTDQPHSAGSFNDFKMSIGIEVSFYKDIPWKNRDVDH